MNLSAFGLVCVILNSSYVTRSQVARRDIVNEGRSITDIGAADEMTNEQARDIQNRINENVVKLRSEGKLNLTAGQTVRFSWPVKKASGQTEFSIGFIGAFVDHNPAFPNQILDWNCGIRTYDQASGYNHRGVDIISQSFPWKRMYQNEQYAVAAAPGVIVLKQDGNFDRNCLLNQGPTGDWNAVYLMHSDGSVTWYGHLKSGSLTRKEVGETVQTGEYLGVTGSSGNSRTPHLHFEIYNAADQLQDAYQGACNTMNNFSWWEVQEPYRNSQILAMYTASAIPQFPTCPNVEVTNEKLVFQPGDTLVTVSTYRDQLVGQETQYSVIRPDGSVLFQWQLVSPQTFDIARYWWQTWQLPADAPNGIWTFRAVYNGESYAHRFYVGQPSDVSVSGRVTTLTGRPVYNALVTFVSDGAAVKRARTSPFGYYRIDDVVVGQTYSVNVSGKALEFLSRTMMVGQELNDLDFMALNEY